MKKFIFFLPILILFFQSCNTTNLPVVTTDNPIYSISSQIVSNSQDKTNPQFLMEFISKSSGADLQFEGAWQNNFSVLKINILGLLGDDFGHLKLTNHALEEFSHPKNHLYSNDLKNLSDFISALGTTGLRNIISGAYAFELNEKNRIFYDNEKNFTKKNTYFTTSKMEIKDHSIDIQSNVHNEYAPQTNSNQVIINSIFFYHFFTSNKALEINWKGKIKNKKVQPVLIQFISDQNNYILKILDFS